MSKTISIKHTYEIEIVQRHDGQLLDRNRLPLPYLPNPEYFSESDDRYPQNITAKLRGELTSGLQERLSRQFGDNVTVNIELEREGSWVIVLGVGLLVGYEAVSRYKNFVDSFELIKRQILNTVRSFAELPELSAYYKFEVRHVRTQAVPSGQPVPFVSATEFQAGAVFATNRLLYATIFALSVSVALLLVCLGALAALIVLPEIQ